MNNTYNTQSLFNSLDADYLQRTNFKLFVFLETLEIYNLRVSELLEAKWHLFDKNHFLIVKGKKKSADIIIRDRILLSKIASLHKSDDTFIFHPLTYQAVYHYLKTNYSHLFKRFKSKNNYKVTHAFRYVNVENTNDEASIKAILHHNSTRSGKFYKKK